jgi:hypothetical protein
MGRLAQQQPDRRSFVGDVEVLPQSACHVEGDARPGGLVLRDSKEATSGGGMRGEGDRVELGDHGIELVGRGRLRHRHSSMPCATRKVTTTVHVRRIGYGPWRLKALYSREECLSGCLTGAYAAALDSTARTYGQKRSKSADWITRPVRADLAFGAGCCRFEPCPPSKQRCC